MLVLCKWCCKFILEGELYLHTCTMLALGGLLLSYPKCTERIRRAAQGIRGTVCKGPAGCAVLAAVLFLGEHLTYVNCIGLVVLVLGVALFNYTKYRKVIMGQVVSARAPPDHEKGGARAEKHEAQDGERAFLVGGRRMNLGEELLSA